MTDKSLVEKITKHITLHNVDAIMITGSSSNNKSYKKSDYDIRIIVKDYKSAFNEIKVLLSVNKEISWKEEDEFSEIKFYYDNQPVHLLFYSNKHVAKCLHQKRRSFISNVVNGTIFYSSSEFMEVHNKCCEIFETLKSSEEYLLAAKSFFVKAMARYENENYIEFIFCLRIASTDLAKHYLNKNGHVFIKEQSLLSEFENTARVNNHLQLFEMYKVIHGLGDLQNNSMQNYIRNFNTILLGVGRDG